MSFLIGLLPDVLHRLPETLGGGGAIAAVASFLPNLRRYAMIGLAIALALAVIGLLWFGASTKARSPPASPIGRPSRRRCWRSSTGPRP